MKGQRFENESIFRSHFSKTCRPFQTGTLKTDQEAAEERSYQIPFLILES